MRIDYYLGFCFSQNGILRQHTEALCDSVFTVDANQFVIMNSHIDQNVLFRVEVESTLTIRITDKQSFIKRQQTNCCLHEDYPKKKVEK